ncbi:MAG: hypothetical protein D3924_02500 [Candidatus Electrothrix sp. AR4]|nr:hypothetical protein [Candidatus Electrothrix sp. AR4]
MERRIYQKQYDFELEQRNHIASSTNTPIVSITVLGGALSSMVMKFPYSHDKYTYLFCFFVGLVVISMLTALVYIFKSFVGYSYQKIPSASKLSSHYSDLLSWHKEDCGDETKSLQLAKDDFDKYLDVRLSEAADNNGDNNIKRGNSLHDATVTIAIALGLLIALVPPFVYKKVNGGNEVHRIEIVNSLKITNEDSVMSKNQGDGNGSSTQQTTPAQTPSAAPAQDSPTVAPTQAAPKPTGPPNIVFKGNVDKVGLTANSTTKTSTSDGGGEK